MAARIRIPSCALTAPNAGCAEVYAPIRFLCLQEGEAGGELHLVSDAHAGTDGGGGADVDLLRKLQPDTRFLYSAGPQVQMGLQRL